MMLINISIKGGPGSGNYGHHIVLIHERRRKS